MQETLVCQCGRGGGRGTLYDVLQVSPWCEQDVIQAAYRALARTRHPDVNRDSDAEDQMRRLNVAYQTLSNPVRRLRYDEELALEAARPAPLRSAATTAAPATAASAAPVRPAAASSGSSATTAGPRPGSGARAASDRPTYAYTGGTWTASERAGGVRNGGSWTASERQTASRAASFHAEEPRPVGTRPVSAGPSAGPSASGLGAAGVSGSSVNYQDVYGATMFETGGTMLLPRSAIYVSIVLVLVIVALVAWLILDTLADRPNAPSRFQRSAEQQVIRESVAFSDRVDRLTVATLEPGLSRLSARWNE